MKHTRLLASFFIASLQGYLFSHPLLIENIQVLGSTIIVRPNEEFKKKYLNNDFFVTYENEVDLSQFDYSILSIPFLMNVVSIVWISQEMYYVEQMDTELYHSLNRVKKVFQVMYPNTDWSGEIVPLTLVDHSLPFVKDENKIASLFSGGVDSVASFLQHSSNQQLLITAWGHWDLPLSNQGIWHERFQKINEFATACSQETSKIRSNYTAMLNYKYLSSLTREIPKWRLGAVEGIGWAGLTAPLLLSKGYATLAIASSHCWNYPYPSAASPFIDHNLRYCGLSVRHTQFELSRLQKIKYICKHFEAIGDTRPFLKVCSYEKDIDENCLRCRKCLTTALCFYALGYDPNPYGLESALEQTQKIFSRIYALFNKDELNFYSIQLGKEIQQTIRHRKEKGHHTSLYLEKFLTINFDEKRAFDTESQIALDWSTMIALLPPDHDLYIPLPYLPSPADDAPVLDDNSHDFILL